MDGQSRAFQYYEMSFCSALIKMLKIHAECDQSATGPLVPKERQGVLMPSEMNFLKLTSQTRWNCKVVWFCSLKRPEERKRVVQGRRAEARRSEAAAISSSGEGDNFMVIWTSPEGFFSFSAQAHRSRWCGSLGSTLIQSCSTYLVIHLTHSLANILSRLPCQERQLLAEAQASWKLLHTFDSQNPGCSSRWNMVDF